MPEPYDNKDDWKPPMTEEEEHIRLVQILATLDQIMAGLRDFKDGHGKRIFEESDDAWR